MQKLNFALLKKHPFLIPLLVPVSLVGVAAVYCLARAAIRSPDVSWNTKANPEPWEEYRSKQYKFYSPRLDYSTISSEAPKYKE